MRRCLFKLGFSTPVHFGGESPQGLENADMTCRADTLFSALCAAALSLGGNAAVERLCALVRDDRLRLSDAMPWQRDVFYLPKPAMTARKPILQTGDRKAFKRLHWISLADYPAYLRAMLEGQPFNAHEPPSAFGESVLHTKGASGRSADEETTPWSVAAFEFYLENGLWFAAECDADETAGFLSELTEALGLSGLGGKISGGYGKFSIIKRLDIDAASNADLKWLSGALQCRTAPLYITLASALPRDDELDAALEGAQYQLVRRGGFMAPAGSAAHKKSTQYFLASGAALQAPFDGDLYEVGAQDGHPICRYGRPMLLGVTL